MQAVGDEPLLSDEQIAYIGGVLLEGGSDTTSSLTLSFILACAAFPDVLVRSPFDFLEWVRKLTFDDASRPRFKRKLIVFADEDGCRLGQTTTRCPTFEYVTLLSRRKVDSLIACADVRQGSPTLAPCSDPVFPSLHHA